MIRTFASRLLPALTGVALAAATHAAAGDLGVAFPDAYKQKGKLLVATYCGYPPFGFTEADQVPKGLDPEIAHDLAELAFGDPDAVEFTCVKSDQRISFLQSGRVDILLTTLGVTIDRAKVIDFSEPYFASTTVFLARDGDAFETFDDVANDPIGVTSGTPWITWMERCKPEIQLVQFDSMAGQVEALATGRLRAAMMDSTAGYPLAEKNPRFWITGPSVDEQGYQWAIGVRKGEAELAAWLNAAIADLQKRDRFWQHLTKYVTNPATLEELKPVVRRPDYTPDYSGFLASVQPEPSCPN